MRLTFSASKVFSTPILTSFATEFSKWHILDNQYFHHKNHNRWWYHPRLPAFPNIIENVNSYTEISGLLLGSSRRRKCNSISSCWSLASQRHQSRTR